uniref:Uncharacterized protein n=1 Tax=Vespula pensylvanica TaxID=30213 RepID=A0A834NQB2_VESPE|nr:hypothetical protein H0235_011977 [Vespula pensylvanica]
MPVCAITGQRKARQYFNDKKAYRYEQQSKTDGPFSRISSVMALERVQPDFNRPGVPDFAQFAFTKRTLDFPQCHKPYVQLERMCLQQQQQQQQEQRHRQRQQLCSTLRRCF